jgi:hypothetical protein
MINIQNCIFTVFFLILFPLISFAQKNELKSDFFESSGKIYVVVAVLVTIFIGIIALLVSLERRVAKLEKEEMDNN